MVNNGGRNVVNVGNDKISVEVIVLFQPIECFNDIFWTDLALFHDKSSLR